MAKEKQLKVCNKCNLVKNIFEFSFSNKAKLYYRSICKLCDAEQTRNYYKNNKEKCLLADKQYREVNKKKLSAYNKKRYVDNKDEFLQRQREYRKTEKGKASKKNDNFRRRLITKHGDVTTVQILDLDKNAKVCYWCNTLLKDKKVHIDHYVPLAKGGEHTLSNLVVSCSKCNLSKKDIDPIVFANSVGKLL